MSSGGEGGGGIMSWGGRGLSVGTTIRLQRERTTELPSQVAHERSKSGSKASGSGDPTRRKHEEPAPEEPKPKPEVLKVGGRPSIHNRVAVSDKPPVLMRRKVQAVIR
eukprot:9486452-Pyramimonas_sp.AAC.1